MKKALLILAGSLLTLAACGQVNPPASSPAGDTSTSTPAAPSSESQPVPSSEAPAGKSSEAPAPASSEAPAPASSEAPTPASSEAPVPSEEPAQSSEVPVPSEEPVQSSEAPVPSEEPVQSSEPEVQKTITNTGAKILDKEGTAYFQISGTYEGYTADEVINHVYYLDLQGNPYYVTGSWSGDWNRYLKDATLDITAADGEFKVEFDISSLKAFAYTTHFVWHAVANPDDENPDLKLDVAIDETVKIGNKNYRLISIPNAGDDGKKFWGTVGLVIEEIGAPEITIASAGIAVDEGAAIVTITVNYENCDFDYVKGQPWKNDWQRNGNVNGDNNWDRIKPTLTFTDVSDGVAAISMDVTDIAVGGHTGHFGIVETGDAPDFKLSGKDHGVTVGDKFYFLDFDGADYWNCVGLVIKNVGEPIATFEDAKVEEEDGRAVVSYYETYFNGTFEDVKAFPWNQDWQRNANYNKDGSWDRVKNPLTFTEPEEGILKISVDVTDVAKGGYTGHFGLKASGDAPDFKLAGKNSGLTLGDKYYAVTFQDKDFWDNISLKVTDATTYRVQELPSWIHDHDAVLFAYVWDNNGYVAWHKLSDEESFVEGAPITGMLIARCVHGTVTPDWSIKEGDEPGRIYNKTRDIAVTAGMSNISAGEGMWVQYPEL